MNVTWVLVTSQIKVINGFPCGVFQFHNAVRIEVRVCRARKCDEGNERVEDEAFHDLIE